MAIEIAQSPMSVLADQIFLEPVHLGLELLRPRRLEVIVPIRLGPRDLQVVSDGVELDVVCNPNSLSGVAKVLALDGVHFCFKMERRVETLAIS